MQPELRQLIEETQFHLPVVHQTMALLPADDAALDELLAEVVASSDLKAFMYVIVAAACAERRMDARHLAGGAMMFPEYRWMGKIVMRMHGDVVAPLLAALENTQMDPVCEAAALHLIAALCYEQRGGVLPDKLMSLARAAARKLKVNSIDLPDLNTLLFLRALAARTNDAGLDTLLRQRYAKIKDKDWKPQGEMAADLGEKSLVTYRESVLDFAPDKPRPTLADGNTMRRAVPRVGRNEPCPCGSGKKYKHCCIAKDEARLHRSSDIPGVTEEELLANMEEHICLKRLNLLPAFQMARLDVAKMPADLRDPYFFRLAEFHLFDHALAGLELLGWSDSLKTGWDHVMAGAGRTGRRDVALRLVRLREPHGFTEADLDFKYQLLLAVDDPARCLQLIEENARHILRTEDMEKLLGLAHAMAFSKFPALGILLYRGVFPLLPPDRAAAAFEQLLLARDKLNLPPDDPFGDIVDKELVEREVGEAKNEAELRATRQSLEAKAQEVRALKDKLDLQEQEITRHEKKQAAAAAVAMTAPEEASLKAMRKKLDELKSALNERHHERNDLRRDLQKAHADLETLRQHAPAITGEAGTDAEDESLLPPDAVEVHPVRLLEFPKGFQATLAGFPRHVARAAIIMCGRLASGEPAAFVGALRLKQVTNVMRQRIGSDYRLFFRLHPGQVEIIDLINRKDFARRLKTLG